jgi:hypothetical protein
MVGELRQGCCAKGNSRIGGVDLVDQATNGSPSRFGIVVLIYSSNHALAKMRFLDADLSDQRRRHTSGPRLRFFLIKLQFCIVILRDRGRGAGKMFTDRDPG